MKLSAALLALLIALPAGAQDVPVPVHKGDVAALDGVLLSTPLAARIAARCSASQEEAAAYKSALEGKPDTVNAVLWAGGIGLVAGVVAGVLIAKAVK